MSFEDYEILEEEVGEDVFVQVQLDDVVKCVRFFLQINSSDEVNLAVFREASEYKIIFFNLFLI